MEKLQISLFFSGPSSALAMVDKYSNAARINVSNLIYPPSVCVAVIQVDCNSISSPTFKIKNRTKKNCAKARRSRQRTIGRRGPETVRACTSRVYGQWGGQESLETKRDGDSENAIKQSCFQRGDRGQSNCSNDWPLVSGIKNLLILLLKSYTCTRQIVFKDGLTPTGCIFKN